MLMNGKPATVRLMDKDDRFTLMVGYRFAADNEIGLHRMGENGDIPDDV